MRNILILISLRCKLIANTKKTNNFKIMKTKRTETSIKITSRNQHILCRKSETINITQISLKTKLHSRLIHRPN